MKESNLISLSDACKSMGVKIHVIEQAERVGRLKIERVSGRRLITPDEIRRYIDSKYMKSARYEIKGETKEFLSPQAISKKYNVPIQKIYYYIYSNKIESKKFGHFHVIKVDDGKKIADSYRKQIQKRMKKKSKLNKK